MSVCEIRYIKKGLDWNRFDLLGSAAGEQRMVQIEPAVYRDSTGKIRLV